MRGGPEGAIGDKGKLRPGPIGVYGGPFEIFDHSGYV
jgi:hypothetical protein